VALLNTIAKNLVWKKPISAGEVVESFIVTRI